MGVRLSRQKPMLEASPENSSEDLVANDLSENDIADDDDDVDGCDNWQNIHSVETLWMICSSLLFLHDNLW